jgi:hypothetical protein
LLNNISDGTTDGIKIFVEHDTTDGIEGKQCQAYIEAKEKKCMKLEISNDKYCCVHFLRKGKNVKILTSIFGGTIIDGSRCRHHYSLTRFAFFCKSNAKTNNSSNSNFRMLKRRAGESFNGSKNHICNDLALILSDSTLEIDIVSVVVLIILSTQRTSLAK